MTCWHGYRSAAAALDLDPSAIRFVHAAARFGIMTHPNVNLTARDLCAALLDYARYHFGGQSNATLELARRRIRNSEDVGRIIYTLAAAGRAGRLMTSPRLKSP